MASRVTKAGAIGNFKPPRKERGHKQSKSAAERPGMDPDHLANIRKLPCCITLKPGPNDPHHIKKTGAKERGMSIRSTDRWAIPMSRAEHDAVERIGSHNELKWFLDRGVDALELAASLWMARGDFEKMHKIVLSHTAVKK